jgi:hypothetical protein
MEEVRTGAFSSICSNLLAAQESGIFQDGSHGRPEAGVLRLRNDGI